MKFYWLRKKSFMLFAVIACLVLSFALGRSLGTRTEKARHLEEAENYCVNSLKMANYFFESWSASGNETSYQKGVSYFSNFAGAYENLMRKEDGQSDTLHVTEYYEFLSTLQHYEAECQERMDAIREAITAVINDLNNVNNYRAFRTIIEGIKSNRS